MLNIAKQLSQADAKRIDKQVQRETTGKSRIDPRWAQAKRRLPTIETILEKPKPQFTGGYGPRATKHPDKRQYLSLKRTSCHMTEGDIPFDAKLKSQAAIQMAAVKQETVLFPGWGRNPLAGSADYGEAKGNPSPAHSAKHPSPMVSSRKVSLTGTGGPIHPPLARTSVQGFQQMVEGWVRR